MQNNLKLDIRITEDQQIFIKDFFTNCFRQTKNKSTKFERNRSMFSQYILKEKTLKELQTDYDLSYTRVNQIVKMSLQKLNRYKRQRFFNYDNNDYISNKWQPKKREITL